MKSFKFVFIILFSLFFTSIFAATEDTVELHYINNTWNNIYRLYWNNFWTDISALKIYLWTLELPNVTKKITSDYLELSNLLNVWWDLAVEKTLTYTSSWKLVTTKTKSNIIKFIKEDTTLLKNTYSIESKWWKDCYVIPFVNWYSDWLQYNTYWITEKASVLNINNQDIKLLKETSTYEDGKYYYNKNSIIFPIKNLTLASNILRLKLDWFFSNYIFINKETYKLEKPKEISVEDFSSSKYIKFVFVKPSNITEINNTEAYINWAKLVYSDFTLTNNNISIRYDIAKFNKDDKVAKIYLKNTLTNNFSNTIIVNIEGYTENKISKIDFWDKKYQNFTLNFTSTSLGWFMWSLDKIKLFINNKEYNTVWISEVTKTSTWVDAKDWLWKLVYQINRKVKFIRSWKDLSLDFLYSNFGTWLNIMYIKNETTWRESNRVSFTWSDFSNINYDYLPTWTKKPLLEQIDYDAPANISDKLIDFINKPDRDINFGKITFTNLVSTNFYRIYFKFSTNLSYNPFFTVKLWSFVLIPTTEADWTISYVFDNSSYWKDFVSWNIILNLNEIKPLDWSNVKFSLSWLSVSKYDYDTSEIKPIFMISDSSDINMSYVYNFWACYDWWKDYCWLEKINKPTLWLNIAFGSELKNSAITQPQTTNITPTTSTQTSSSSETKKNSPINTINYKSDKNKNYNIKFIKLYDKIKLKNITARQATTLKTSINNILKALKDLEDGKSKTEINITIKSNLRKIVDIIKSAK